MKFALNEAINEYWIAISDKPILWTKQIFFCEKITLRAYKLLKYIRTEVSNINPCIDDEQIKDLNDSIMGFYYLTEDGKTPYQEESNTLEVLSRAAYREMKDVQKKRDEEEAEINR